jgi:hypothetical protein
MSLSIVTGYVQDGQGSIPSRDKILVLSITSRLSVGPTQPPAQWVPGALSLVVQWQVCEADHSPPCSAEVNNGGAIPSLPHTSPWHSF